MAILPSSQCRGINSSISCYTHSPCFTRVLHTDLFYFLLCLLLQVPAHRSFATPNHSLSIQYANRDRSSSCAMGKSRSATVVIAYLMQKHNISPSDALAHVRQARSIAEPNEGFWKQLELYSEMQTPDNVEETPAYQRWVYQRELELSRACAQAPEADKIRFEDEHATEQTSGFEMRCRKCRRPLATSQYLTSHSQDPSKTKCAHYFVDPLSWMRPELEQGKLEGRIECPNCKSNVGKYAWQGMQCSCGDWMVPGISLAKGRIDEARKGGVSGIRRPPGAPGAPLPTLPTPPKQNLGRENL